MTVPSSFHLDPSWVAFVGTNFVRCRFIWSQCFKHKLKGAWLHIPSQAWGLRWDQAARCCVHRGQPFEVSVAEKRCPKATWFTIKIIFWSQMSQMSLHRFSTFDCVALASQGSCQVCRVCREPSGRNCWRGIDPAKDFRIFCCEALWSWMGRVLTN